MSSGSFNGIPRRFYIPTADTIFRVDNCLFRAHSHFFTRESAYFRNLITHGPDAPGTSDHHPLKLSGEHVTSESFENFLWIFYNRQYSIYDASVETWSSILRLASKWDFPEVKALAVRELEKKDNWDPVDKISLYQDHDIDPVHLVDAFAQLTKRDEPISIADGMRLGLETSLHISQAREISRLSEPGTPSPVTVTGPHLQSLIYNIFDLPDPSPPPVLSEPTPRSGATATGAARVTSPRIMQSSSSSSESPPSYDRLTGVRVDDKNGQPDNKIIPSNARANGGRRH